MPKNFYLLAFSLLLTLTACKSPAASTQAEPLRVQFTFAAQPWLANLETCAGENTISPELRSLETFDLSNLDLAIRIGENNVTTPAYQIGTEDILVIVNPQNPLTSLESDEVLALFTGQTANWQSINGTDAPVQVWVFSSDEDIQQIFEQTGLDGAPVTSLARQASGPDEMARAIADNVNAVGILTQRQMEENVSAIYTVTTIPVLVLTDFESSATVQEIVACLQK